MAAAVGLILVAAAILKLVGLSASPVAQVGWLANPAVQSAAAVAELVLGGWLLSGVTPRLAWLFAVAAFGTFAVVSGQAAVAGQPTCNCFGPLAVNPWWVCGFDLAVLALLLAVRPTAAQFRAEWSAGGGTLVGTLAVAALGSWAWHASGLGQTFDRVILGRTIRADSAIDFGTVQPGSDISQPVRVWNDGPTPITVVGGTSDCSCLVAGELPVVVPPGESRAVTVKLRVAPDARGPMYRTIELWIDSGRQPRLPVAVGFDGGVTRTMP